MFRKSFAFILLTASACIVGTAQTPEPKSKGEPKVFSFSFDSDGGYLGVQTQEVTRENFSKFGLKEVRGVAVEKVVENSPAQTAGIQNGDVIVKVNGEEITSTRKLTRLIGEISPDHTARITVARSGGERDIDVTLGKRPTPKFGDGAFSMEFPEGIRKMMPPDAREMPNLEKLPRVPGSPDAPMVWTFGNRRQIGIGLITLTDQLADHFDVSGGVMINSVRENSPAAKAGLKAGDIIVEVEGKVVKTDREFIRAIAEKKEGDVSLTIVRDRNRQTVRVTPEEVKGRFNNFFEFPDMPDAPAVFKIGRPAVPSVPLNQLLVPGRVV